MHLSGKFRTYLCSFGKVLTRSTGLTGIWQSKKNGKYALVRLLILVILVSTIITVISIEEESISVTINGMMMESLGSAPRSSSTATIRLSTQNQGLSDTLNMKKSFPRSEEEEKRNSVCVVTRSRDDFKVLDNFIQHYFEEGVQEIWVIEDSNAMHRIKSARPKVHVKSMDLSLFSNQKQMDPVADLIRSGDMDGCEWIVPVDADEFLTTRRNPCKTIVEEIQDNFGKKIDSISVPWVFYSSTHENVEDVRTQVLMRWNHSAHHGLRSSMRKYRDRYRQIETKPIFRRSKFVRFSSPHGVVLVNGSICVDGASGKIISSKSMHFKRNYHEEEIKDSLLSLNHYRFPSIKHMKHKCMHRNKKSFNGAAYGLDADKCLDSARASNAAEMHDDILLRKIWFRRLGLENNCKGFWSFNYTRYTQDVR